MQGKTVCYHHGGKSKGAKKGNKHALTHGIYSDGLFEHEKESWDQITVGSVDDEIKIAKIQLARAMKALKAIEESPRGQHGEELEKNQVAFELAELEDKVSGNKVDLGINPETGDVKVSPSHERIVVRKRPDYRAIIDRLLGRIGKLELTRSTIGGQGDGDGNIREMLDAIHGSEPDDLG